MLCDSNRKIIEICRRPTEHREVTHVILILWIKGCDGWNISRRKESKKSLTSGHRETRFVALVAVLQFSKSLPPHTPNTSISIYIFIYIDIEFVWLFGSSCFGTATLQHRNTPRNFFEKNPTNIREPQWECCTFALVKPKDVRQPLGWHALLTSCEVLSTLSIVKPKDVHQPLGWHALLTACEVLSTLSSETGDRCWGVGDGGHHASPYQFPSNSVPNPISMKAQGEFVR